MSKPVIALVSARSARALDDDLLPLQHVLITAGACAELVDWDDTTIDWSRYSVALLRSTWDYTQRLPEFLAWAERTAQITRLLNPLDVVRWNTDKHYLHDLAAAGIPVVPSFFIESGQSAHALPDHDEFVVKPAVGAGSRDAQRYVRSERAVAITHAQRLLDAHRSVLVQPYLHAVDRFGESALLYFNGSYSHSIRKSALLKRGEVATRALFATEHISARNADADERALAEQTLAAIPFTQPLLYARIDMIRDADNRPSILELELTEPSLYFAFGEGSVQRFAAAIIAKLNTFNTAAFPQ
jgi:glutathione synthase/RimK-type ligase-like ATP-grasp enzyme